MLFLLPKCTECGERTALYTQDIAVSKNAALTCSHCNSNLNLNLLDPAIDFRLANKHAVKVWHDAATSPMTCLICLNSIEPKKGYIISREAILDTTAWVQKAAKTRGQVIAETSPGGDISQLLGRDAEAKLEMLSVKVLLEEFSQRKESECWVCKKCASIQEQNHRFTDTGHPTSRESEDVGFITYPCINCGTVIRSRAQEQRYEVACPRCHERVVVPLKGEHREISLPYILESARQSAVQFWDLMISAVPTCAICLEAVKRPSGFLLPAGAILRSEQLIKKAINRGIEVISSGQRSEAEKPLNKITRIGMDRITAEDGFIDLIEKQPNAVKEVVTWVCDSCIKFWECYGMPAATSEDAIQVPAFWFADPIEVVRESNLSANDYLLWLQQRANESKNYDLKASDEGLRQQMRRVGISSSEYESLIDSSGTPQQLGDEILQEYGRQLREDWDEDLRHRIEDVPIGCMLTRLPSAETIYAPNGDPLIVVDTGLMIVLNAMNKLVARFTGADAVDPFDPEELKRAVGTVGLISIFYSTAGATHFPRVPLPPESYQFILSNRLTEIQEKFIIAHEYAHIANGHLKDHGVKRAVRLSSETVYLRYPLKQHKQEFEADLVALEAIKRNLQKANSPFDLAAIELFFGYVDLLETVDPLLAEATCSHPPTTLRTRAIRAKLRNSLPDDGRLFLFGAMGMLYEWGRLASRFLKISRDESPFAINKRDR